MAEPQHEEIKLDLEPIDEFLRRTPALIERHKARTANAVAILLVSGVIASLPIHLGCVLVAPDSATAILPVFDKWYALVSPLAGAAVGAYYATRNSVAKE